MPPTEELPLVQAYLTQRPVMTPLGLGIIQAWQRHFEYPGLTTDYVDDITVRLITTDRFDRYYYTSDLTTLQPSAE